MKAAALAFPLLLALQSDDFDTLKQSATPVQSISKALLAIVGNCENEDRSEQYDCEENMKKLRKDHAGKRAYVYLGAVEPTQLKYEGDKGGGKVRVVWTAPIYDAGEGLALTVGKPQSVSPKGTLVLRPVLIDGKLPADIVDTDIPRLIRTGGIAVELIGKFGSAWRLRGKARAFQGADFAVDAIRLSNSRTGKTLLVSKL